MQGKCRDSSKTTVKSSHASFDTQANTYDQRAGLPEKTCRQIAQTVLAIAEAQPGDLVVEVGAGTGQIGQWFPQASVRYLGFDLSGEMLEQFRQRLDSEGVDLRLLQADCNQQWPVANSTVRIIFSSRTLHLLKPEHIVDQSFRVALPEGAVLLLGSVERQKESVKTRMKEQMGSLLRQHGFQGREKKQSQRQLIELFCQRGAEEIEPVVVSWWKVANAPRQSLESWRGKPGLAGIDLPAGIKQDILRQLQVWAEATFGRLDLPLESEEAYLLQGVRLSGPYSLPLEFSTSDSAAHKSIDRRAEIY